MKLLRHFLNFFVPHKGNDHKPHLFREEGIAFLLVVIMIATAFSFSGKIAVQTKFLTASVQSLLLADLANENRLDNNLPELVWNDTLARAAQLKADDMASKSYFAHTSPEGITPWHWFTQAGYYFTFAGENLAVNYTESVDVDQAWMDSPTHRANILNGNFTEIGIATAVGQYKGRETTFVVQMFASPLIQLPTRNTTETRATEEVAVETTTAPLPIPEVLGEETGLQESVETLFVSDTYIAVENTSSTDIPAQDVAADTALLAEESDQAETPTVLASTSAHVIDNSVHYTAILYRILLAIVGCSLLLMIVIEYKKQHKKNIAYAVGVILLLALLLLVQAKFLHGALSII